MISRPNFSTYVSALEIAMVLTGLLYFMIGQFRINELLPGVISSLVKYGVWTITSLYFIVRASKSFAVAASAKFLFAFSILCVISIAWSSFPDVTFAKVGNYLQMFTFSVYVASRFDVKRIIILLLGALGIATFLSLVLSILFPSLGLQLHEGKLVAQGVFNHKNVLGRHMVLASLTFTSFIIIERSKSFLLWLGLFSSLILILMTGSKSALGNLIVGILAILFYDRLRMKGKLTVMVLDCLLLVLIPTGFIIFTNWVEILDSIGRDPTITGRTFLWEYAIEKIQENRLLGFGYGTFWSPETGHGIAVARRYFNGTWDPPNAHNGFIDVILSLGFVGFALLLTSFVLSYVSALRRVVASKKLEDMWHLSLLHFLAIYSMTESILATEQNIFWIAYMTSTFSQYQLSSKRKHHTC